MLDPAKLQAVLKKVRLERIVYERLSLSLSIALSLSLSLCSVCVYMMVAIATSRYMYACTYTQAKNCNQARKLANKQTTEQTHAHPPPPHTRTHTHTHACTAAHTRCCDGPSIPSACCSQRLMLHPTLCFDAWRICAAAAHDARALGVDAPRATATDA